MAKIFEIKGRPRFNPLIVHLADRSQANLLVDFFPDKARLLAREILAGTAHPGSA